MERQKRAGGLKGKGQRIYYNPKKSGSCSRGPPGRSCSLKQKKKSLITHDPKGQREINPPSLYTWIICQYLPLVKSEK